MKTPLYGRKIKGLKHDVRDLRAIAHFNRIIKNYLKMDALLKKEQDAE